MANLSFCLSRPPYMLVFALNFILYGRGLSFGRGLSYTHDCNAVSCLWSSPFQVLAQLADSFVVIASDRDLGAGCGGFLLVFAEQTTSRALIFATYSTLSMSSPFCCGKAWSWPWAKRVSSFDGLKITLPAVSFVFFSPALFWERFWNALIASDTYVFSFCCSTALSSWFT